MATGSKKRPPAGASTPAEGLTTRRDILLMAAQNPTDHAPSDPASITQEEERTENTVLSLLLDEHPTRLTLDEVALVLNGERRIDDPEDAAELAAYRLACFGLIYRDGGFLLPTRAALRFERLRADD